MGYMHIYNLYKVPEIFLLKEVYALEKVHGTSAHIGWHENKLSFFSGGERHENFVSLFDAENLANKFIGLGQPSVTVYGEAFGGKLQGMKLVYGPNLRFVVFDVKVGDKFVSVPQAKIIASTLGLQFVDYAIVPTNEDALTRERDRPSVEGERVGIRDGVREGVVLRPLIELTINRGRLIAKFKADKFNETTTTYRKLNASAEELKTLEDAAAIALEWVTPMRLRHVLDKILPGGEKPDMRHTEAMVRAMVADIEREGEGEIVWSKEARKSVGKATVVLFKQCVKDYTFGKAGD